MKFQKLGNTDIDVSVVALGTWGLGGGSVWTDGDSTVEDVKSLTGFSCAFFRLLSAPSSACRRNCCTSRHRSTLPAISDSGPARNGIEL